MFDTVEILRESLKLIFTFFTKSIGFMKNLNFQFLRNLHVLEDPEHGVIVS